MVLKVINIWSDNRIAVIDSLQVMRYPEKVDLYPLGVPSLSMKPSKNGHIDPALSVHSCTASGCTACSHCQPHAEA